MEKKNFYRQLRLSCVVLMAVFALSASAQSSRQVRPYSFNKKGVFYGRQPVMGIDIRTSLILGMVMQKIDITFILKDRFFHSLTQ